MVACRRRPLLPLAPKPAADAAATQVNPDTEWLNWLDQELRKHNDIHFHRTEVFTVSNQWVTAITGIRSLIDTAQARAKRRDQNEPKE